MDYEKVLQKKIFPELESGRPNWDRPHTLAVVKHIKAIIKNSPSLNLDEDALVIAAYAHDWGYADLFEGGKPLSLDDVNSAKKAHMIIGAKKITKLLKNTTFNFLTKTQKLRIAHLVRVHDKVNILKDVDELVLMEADTLGGLDITMVKPSFDKDSNERYMRGVKMKRFPLFITDYGKQAFKKLFKSRKDYYANQ